MRFYILYGSRKINPAILKKKRLEVQTTLPTVFFGGVNELKQ
jgi:hypothetical protein